jgi:hypothetical protein
MCNQPTSRPRRELDEEQPAQVSANHAPVVSQRPHVHIQKKNATCASAPLKAVAHHNTHIQRIAQPLRRAQELPITQYLLTSPQALA